MVKLERQPKLKAREGRHCSPRIEDFDRFVFVVGAPRCGTTTLSHFLKSHPSINVPAVKEPHFFAQHDLRGLPESQLRERVEEDYLRRFYEEDPSRPLGTDASVTYLYTAEQLEPILLLWPNSRFIVTLRDPLTMLPSLHQRLIYLGDETISDFARAWAATPDRAAGRRIPRSCADPRWLRYDEAARFGTYVERLYAAVGRERCMVMLFDDLAADPAEQYRQLMDFIGLEPAAMPTLEARRSSRAVRIHWLQRLLKRPPIAMRKYFAGELFQHRIRDVDDMDQGKPQKAVWSLRKRLLRWNRISRPARAIPLSVQVEISKHYQGEIDKLSRLIDRDLSHWLKPKADLHRNRRWLGRRRGP